MGLGEEFSQNNWLCSTPAEQAALLVPAEGCCFVLPYDL